MAFRRAAEGKKVGDRLPHLDFCLLPPWFCTSNDGILMIFLQYGYCFLCMPLRLKHHHSPVAWGYLKADLNLDNDPRKKV